MKKILYIIGFPILVFATNSELSEPLKTIEVTAVDKEVKPSLSIVQLNGAGVTLTNGSSYAIHPDDWGISSLWINVAAPVDVYHNPDGGDYPLRIKNTITGTSVRAALIPEESSLTTPESPTPSSSGS